MKPITLHPGSALAGAGVLALVLLATGAGFGSGPLRVFVQNDVGVQGIPKPQQMMRVPGDQPASEDDVWDGDALADFDRENS